MTDEERAAYEARIKNLKTKCKAQRRKTTKANQQNRELRALVRLYQEKYPEEIN